MKSSLKLLREELDPLIEKMEKAEKSLNESNLFIEKYLGLLEEEKNNMLQ